MFPGLLLFAFVSAPQQALPLREVLAIEPLGERRRSPVHTDALEALWVEGAWEAPVEGGVLASTTGEERSWERIVAAEDGWFSGAAFRGGWAFATIDVPTSESEAWCLDASGHADVLVDGEPHAGDAYGMGITRLPLALEPGRHEFLFRCGRGRLRATLEPAPAPVYLEEKDRTLPDVIRGEGGRIWIGTIVANAQSEPARGFTLRARAGERTSTSAVPVLLPSSFRKCVLALEVPSEPDGDSLVVTLELLDAAGEVVYASSFSLAVRAPHDRHERTFLSEVDGSVQYYAVTPPPAEAARNEAPALVLSLHGASVEARGQAACYRPRDWAVIVAPTNRRPYGFDWEDTGRQDALEVLELSAKRYGTDPLRVVLTGHSMGGHGTWQLGAHFPDRFAAIAPSAGWKDFWSYSGSAGFDATDPIGPLLDRAANASRTGLLLSNYAGLGVYVLHGDADETVPVDEARAMRAALGAFHPNFVYYERPGAGHWWGNECMDWPPLMDFLERHRLPDAARAWPARTWDVDFTTVDAAVSNRYRYLRILGQGRVLEPSRVKARFDAKERVLTLELENVFRLAIDPAPFQSETSAVPLTVRIAETSFGLEGSEEILIGRGREGEWQVVSPLGRWYKNADRAGPFKAAFRRRFLLVYGTQGSAEENAWSLAKARYDHEQWRYRGNGAVDVFADVDFRPEDHPDRDVILYGNQDTNGSWDDVVTITRGLELRRDRLRLGDHVIDSDAGLTFLMVYPRKGSDLASVAVVGHTGMAGARAATFLPYFVSGVGFPDWTVIGSESLRLGLAGFRGAGYFRTDWSIEAGAETSWR